MIRGHVQLSLCILVGMLFIVDLYVACAYLSYYFDEMEERESKLNGRGRDEGVYDPKKHIPGLGTDYGFNLKNCPPGAFKFSYVVIPTDKDGREIKMSVIPPMQNLMDESIDPNLITTFVADRIFDHYNFKRSFRGYYFVGGDPLRSTEKGKIWVAKEVADKMKIKYLSAGSMEIVEFTKRKRSANDNGYLSGKQQHQQMFSSSNEGGFQDLTQSFELKNSIVNY